MQFLTHFTFTEEHRLGVFENKVRRKRIKGGEKSFIKKSFIILVHKYYYKYQIKEDCMGRPCSTNRRTSRHGFGRKTKRKRSL
jgi:hypothetical protein